jgi:hypothetical protein
MDSIISNENICAIQFSESFTYKNGLSNKKKRRKNTKYFFYFIKMLLSRQVFGLVQVPVV